MDARGQLRKVTWALLCLLVPLRSTFAQEGAAASLRPPEVLQRVDAVYPPEALAARQEATVVLRVSVGGDGTVTDVAVDASAGAAFDQAAIAAIRQWRFL